ncbi:hypothetical protein COO92_17935 [Thalassospira lohafexi]|uniref:Uncharacterized protein n=1 Tax=Thalassospira lohafexi TaxID=744227 RepID=A0A2N3L239_9PROT|nr:hypothetical protein COO92_17935 [Thalassospira lohafexi]
MVSRYLIPHQIQRQENPAFANAGFSVGAPPLEEQSPSEKMIKAHKTLAPLILQNWLFYIEPILTMLAP